MSDKLFIALIFCVSILGAIISSGPFKDRWRHGSTDISVFTDDNEAKFTASYPKSQARKVHNYMQQALRLTDMPDMRNLEIKNYRTPDAMYIMDIQSRDGYIKVIMDRRKNPSGTFEHLKLVSEGVRKVLADN